MVALPSMRVRRELRDGDSWARPCIRPTGEGRLLRPRASEQLVSRTVPTLCFHVYLLSILQRIGWIHDDLVIGIHATQNFNTRSEVTSDDYGPELHLLVRPHNSYPRALGAKEQRIDRNRDADGLHRNREMHLGKSAGQQTAIVVLHIDFSEQSTGCGIDRIGSAHHLAGEFLPRVFIQLNVSGHALMDVWRICLRNAYVHAQ